MRSYFEPAKAGDLVDVRGIECRVFLVRPCGTVDVEATDGSGRCFRLTGCLVRVQTRAFDYLTAHTTGELR